MSHPAILPGVPLSDQRTGLERLKFAVEKNRAGETGSDSEDLEDFSPVFPGAIWLNGDSELSEVLANLEAFIAWKEAALIEAETAQAVEMAVSEASHPGFSGVGGI